MAVHIFRLRVETPSAMPGRPPLASEGHGTVNVRDGETEQQVQDRMVACLAALQPGTLLTVTDWHMSPSGR